jgi:hypothetical protein
MRLMEVREMDSVRMVSATDFHLLVGVDMVALNDLTDYENNEFVYIY